MFSLLRGIGPQVTMGWEGQQREMAGQHGGVYWCSSRGGDAWCLRCVLLQSSAPQHPHTKWRVVTIRDRHQIFCFLSLLGTFWPSWFEWNHVTSSGHWAINENDKWWDILLLMQETFEMMSLPRSLRCFEEQAPRCPTTSTMDGSYERETSFCYF